MEISVTLRLPLATCQRVLIHEKWENGDSPQHRLTIFDLFKHISFTRNYFKEQKNYKNNSLNCIKVDNNWHTRKKDDIYIDTSYSSTLNTYNIGTTSKRSSAINIILQIAVGGNKLSINGGSMHGIIRNKNSITSNVYRYYDVTGKLCPGNCVLVSLAELESTDIASNSSYINSEHNEGNECNNLDINSIQYEDQYDFITEK
ncbi:hypothetical protein U3516DRAFT_740672 [Neocallimastix sp. 'constans']